MKKGFGLLEIIVIMIVTSLISGITTGVIMLNSNTAEINGSLMDISKDKELVEFIELYETLISRYYDDIDKEGMLNAAEEGMTKFLGDKYTTYLEDEDYNKLMDGLSGTYKGIGVAFLNRTVEKVTKDSPAEKAGILAGDIIKSINGVNVEELEDEVIGTMIKNDKQKKVELIIERNGILMNFSLEKAELIDPSITYQKIEDTNIGYISINTFSENLSLQVSNALKELENDNINSLIIDVRNNPGGYLSAAEETASLFLEQGKIIYSLEKGATKANYEDKTKEKRNYPIVVLTNKISASASEILAAALKESYNAILVGNKTYGKGKVQQVFDLQNGDSVKYTSAKWLTPKGVCIDGVGITPDYIVDNYSGDSTDYQLNKAIDLLK